jgi:hypothetical protein
MSPRANALVDAARVDPAADAARAARLRARVMTATGAAAGATAAAVAVKSAVAPAAASTAPAAAGSAVATKVSMGVGAKIALYVLGAAAIAGGTHVVDRFLLGGAEPARIVERAAPAAPAPAPIVTTRFVLLPSIVFAPAPLAAPPALRAHAATSTMIAPAPAPAAPPRAVSADERALLDETPPTFDQGADALARELSEVRGAQAALRDGDGATALIALDAHDHDFPAGQLAEEAGVLRVEALCAVGRTIDASDARASFLARFPRSAQRVRAQRACGGERPP